MVSAAKKKLLILDVNGLLLDTYYRNDKRPDRRADGKVNKHHVYRRPYCDEFIEFCFENFEMGIWSSAREHNVEGFTSFIFGDLKSKLLFIWHQAHCTDTGLKTPGNRYKPVFLKELSKLWNKVKPDLPWEKGDFGPSNTLLIDDSPYKALRNLPYTAVFPDPYKVSNGFDDSLGGALRKYLEGLATALDVQYYVKHHPFGQPPISKESQYWNFYRQILLPVEDSAPYMEEEENDMVNAAIPILEKSLPSENREDGLHTGNVQHSELISCIGKREKKRKNHPVTSTNPDSAPYMEEEENDMVNAAIPNLEKSVPSENREDGLHIGNVQYSELSSCIGKREKKRKNRPVTSTNQDSAPYMEEEENDIVNAAIPNLEKRVPSENREDGLHTGNVQHSELSSCIGKREKKRKHHPLTSPNQDSAPYMEKEENDMVNAAIPNLEKGVPSENREDGLHTGNVQQSELSSCIGKREKKRKNRPVNSTNQDSGPYMEEEENGIVNAAIPILEKSVPSENRKDGLHTGNVQHSELSSCIGKRENKRKNCPATSTYQSSAPYTEEEENDMVNAAIPNLEKSVPSENREGVLHTGNVQHSELSSCFGKREKKRKNRPVSSANQSSAPYMEEEENDMVNAAIPNLEKRVPSKNREDGLHTGNVHSELSSCIHKREKKRKNHPVTNTNQSSVPGEEEDNGVVKVAVLNMEKCKSSETKKENLQSGNRPQSESSSRSGKHKMRHKNHLGTSTNQSSVPSMEEDKSVVNMEMLNTEKSVSSKNIRDNLQSGNGLKSEVSSRSEKRKKRRKDRSSVRSMEEDNSVVNMAMLNPENITDNLQSGNGLQSEVSLLSGKRKKKCKDRLSTTTNQSSVPSMEEENGLVNMVMLNMEKSISLENRKVNLQSGDGQQSESSSRSGKQKRRQRDCPLTGTGESSFLAKQKGENGVAEMGMLDVGKSRSITQALLSQEHANYLSEHGKPLETGLSQNSSFCNHKRKHKHFENASVSRGSAPAVEYRDDGLAETIDSSTRKGYGTTVASFGQEAVAAQTDEEHCGNKPCIKFRDKDGFRYEKEGHHYKPAYFSPNRHMNSNRWSSSYCQRDSQASYFPGRQFQVDRGHNKGFDPSIHTRVQSNFPPHPLNGYMNDGRDRWLMHNGFHLQHVPPCQSHNPSHIGYPVCQSYNTNLGATEFRGPLMQHQFQLHVQMPATDDITQYQRHGRNFHHYQNNFRSKHGGSNQFQK